MADASAGQPEIPDSAIVVSSEAVAENFAASDKPTEQHVGEPVQSQQKLVPHSERKPGFWERVGNGFRVMSDLARGQRPVKALAVLPFKPQSTTISKPAKEVERERSIHIPAFTLQIPGSISQAGGFESVPETTASDLVTHWSDYPAASQSESAEGDGAAAGGPARRSPQTAASP